MASKATIASALRSYQGPQPKLSLLALARLAESHLICDTGMLQTPAFLQGTPGLPEGRLGSHLCGLNSYRGQGGLTHMCILARGQRQVLYLRVESVPLSLLRQDLLWSWGQARPISQ